MTDRENSPAYAALPRSARRVFAAIDPPSTWWPGERQGQMKEAANGGGVT